MATLLAVAGCTDAPHPSPVVAAARTATPTTARDSGTLRLAAAFARGHRPGQDRLPLDGVHTFLTQLGGLRRTIS